MSFPRYPEYKDSGVEWLEEVPAHWDARRLKFLFTLQKRAPREDDGIVTAFRDGEVTLRSNRRTEGFTNAIHEIGYQGVRRGDLVIHAMDAFAGAIGVSDSDGKSTPVYSVCIPANRNINAWYYGQLLRNMALSGYVNSLAKGVRERSTEFRWADASEVILPVPDVIEQQAIATFLDRETTKINALVAEQEKLIALLQEKRQAVISHAVTKGLDPNVPMKDSGVEWLGEVPRHWNINGFRRGIDFLTDYEANGSFADTKAAVSLEEGIPFAWYVRATDLENGRFGLAADNRWCDSTSYDFLQKTQLIGGELLIAKRGEIGKVYLMPIVDCPSTLAPNLYLARLNRTLLPKFAHFWFLSDFGKPQLELCNKSTTIGALYKDDVRSLICPFPPQPEQELISRFLDRETESIQSLIGEAELGINLLQERRTALISAAVTGQIDVRGLAGGANAPDSIAASAYPESAGG